MNKNNQPNNYSKKKDVEIKSYQDIANQIDLKEINDNILKYKRLKKSLNTKQHNLSSSNVRLSTPLNIAWEDDIKEYYKNPCLN